jgi:Holliday junction DNA helicase RuvA
MIAQIQGKLLKIDTDAAQVQVGPIVYEVMLPGYGVNALAGKIGQEVTLCTMEYYEGNPAGGNLVPRMVGFLSPGEKDFFAKFISVKGIGIRKALRSLNMPIGTVAEAIESGDEKLLLSLPEVGKRLAQQIIAELKGKLQSFALGAVPAAAQTKFERYQAEALEVLIAWGERRSEAIDLISLACERHPEIKSAEQLVPLAYRIKQGIEV